MNDQILTEIGLTKNEIIIYKKLLELGQTTTGPLTKKSKIHRSRVYESLNRLIDKGLVSYVIKSNKKHYKAQNPEVILELFEERRKQIKIIMPELKALQKNKPDKQEAIVFEGYKGLKSVFNNAISKLKKGEEILVFGARSGQDISPKTWASFFKNFNERRIQKGIKYKIIFNEDLKNTEIVKEFAKSRLTQIRYILQDTPTGINIHGNNVAIITWGKNPHAFLITSKEASQSFREYFKVMWNNAK